MSLAKHCGVHPDRPAIGVCVVTQRPMCAACSTPYKGVNYSKEGLEILLGREREQQKALDRRPIGFLALVFAAFPVCLLCLYSWWHMTGQFIVDFVQGGRG